MATTEEDLEFRDASDDVVPGEGQAPDAEASERAERDDGAEEFERSPNRIAVACAFPTIVAAISVGGVFNGASPRFYAAVAGLLGVGLAFVLARLRNRAVLTNVLAIVGLFAIGLLLIGPGNLFSTQTLVNQAIEAGDVLRPPVDFDPGWKAITGWLMGTVGFAAAWVAIVFRKPALGLLLPLPVAAFAAISIPDSAQVATGIVGIVLFAVSLGILSSEQSVGEDGTAPSIGYELRKALKAFPLLAALVVGLYFLAQTDFLFPDSVIDPAQEPQKPKTPPLTEVEDRVLFEVRSDLSGPWRTGVLDVYDGEDWRLPPFAASEIEEVPRSGVVNPERVANVRATFTISGMGGAVLPGLPNTVGVIARGPNLAYDARSGNIRLVNGQLTPGIEYTVAAAGLPTVDDLNAIQNYSGQIPPEIREFTDIPDAPPAVVDLLNEAREAGESKWQQFDYARTWVLDNVTAKGTGQPVSVTPDRVQEIIGGEREASPFEIVATQAMLGRWLDIPSRIGYGFDGGEQIEDVLHVRPKHGAAFPEVYFPNYGWLPVIGTPKKAEPTVGSDPSTQKVDPNILPSDDIAVQIFVPTLIPPGSVATEQALVIMAIVIPLLLLALALYTVWPAFVKARMRARRREAALDAGVRARVAQAYSDWRDYATDFGFLYPTDTPLMFLDRFQEDDEHTELAWLTTRVLWGDLQDESDPMLATVADELSRSLRRRLASAQPGTVRAVATVSRLSLRHPYAPEADLSRPAGRNKGTKSRKEEDREALSV